METTKTWELFQCKICYTFLLTRDKIWAHLWTRHSIMNTSTTLNKIQIPDVAKDWEIVTSIKPVSEIWVKVEQPKIAEGKELDNILVKNDRNPSPSRVPHDFKCHTCNDTFANSKQLYNHRMRSKMKGCRRGRIAKKNIKKTLFACSVCKMGFEDRKTLLVHKFEKGHKPHLAAQSNYTCQYGECGRKFRTLKMLELHSCRHDPRWEGMTPGERTQFKVDRVVEIGAKVYPCPLCPAKILFGWLLPKHLMNHSKDRPAKCDKCQATFKTEQSLTKHLKLKRCERRLKEMESNRFHCDICKKFLKTEKYLRSHQSTYHGISQSKMKDYTCLFCGHSTNCASELEKHNRIHTGERPFECQGCGKSFAVNHNLIRHMRRNCKALKASGIIVPAPEKRTRKTGIGVKVKPKGDDGDPLHLEKCPNCPQTFRKKGHLTAHIKAHGNNFSCNECGAGFIRLSALSKHLQIVHRKPGVGVKVKVNVRDSSQLEKCPNCPQTFSEKRLLAQHIRVHGKNFFCTECQDVGFNHLTPLTKHYSIVHGEKGRGIQCHICSRMLCRDDNMKKHYFNVHGRKFKDVKELVQFMSEEVPLLDLELGHLDHNPHYDRLLLPSVVQSGEGQMSDYVQNDTFDTDLVTPAIVVKYEDEL